MNAEEVKSRAVDYARTWFSDENFPCSMSWDADGELTISALNLGIKQCVALLRGQAHACAVLMSEAYGGSWDDDIIIIQVDHAEGEFIGRLGVKDVNGKRVLDEKAEWTTEKIQPEPGHMIRFPYYPKLVLMRLVKKEDTQE